MSEQNTTSTEYNKEILDQIISLLELLTTNEIQKNTIQTTNNGETVVEIKKYFDFYDNLYIELQHTIQNILQTVRNVRDEVNPL